jgi:hypothetical protein
VLADIEDGEDVRVVQRRGGAGLAGEAGQGLRVGGELRGEDFEGDLAAEQRVGGEVDVTHPAGADLRADLVAT